MNGEMGHSGEAFHNNSSYHPPGAAPFRFPVPYDGYIPTDGWAGGPHHSMYEQQQHIAPDSSVSRTMGHLLSPTTTFSPTTTSPGSYDGSYHFPDGASQPALAAGHERPGQPEGMPAPPLMQSMPPFYQGSFYESPLVQHLADPSYHDMPVVSPFEAPNGLAPDGPSDEAAPKRPPKRRKSPPAVSPPSSVGAAPNGPSPIASAPSDGAASRDTSAGADADPSGDAQRAKVLERNRIAASKCREKKKTQAAELERTARALKRRQADMQLAAAGLREQVMGLKAELLEHVDCGCARIRDFFDRELDRVTRTDSRNGRDGYVNGDGGAGKAVDWRIEAEDGEMEEHPEPSSPGPVRNRRRKGKRT